MLMERALHDQSALWQVRVHGHTVSLNVTRTADGVSFIGDRIDLSWISGNISDPSGNISEELDWEILLDGEVVYIVRTKVPEHTGSGFFFCWDLSLYRLTLV